MFRFLELSLHGWDLWPPVRIPLDRDVVLVTGTNGSGKTTLLDAIRQLLNAPRLSSKRRLQNYLRRPDAPALIRAVVSNEEANGTSAPFRRERITTSSATLACALVPGGGGSPEKRFAILPGRPPIEEIRRALLESRDWYHPERYSQALEHAGVTRSLMGVLAIEQGRTNSLFELRPRELFRQALEMLGDRAVLERYRETRRRYEESEREVFQQESALQARQVELTRVMREVEQLDTWERVRDRRAELEARLPAAELQALLRQRAEYAAKIPELRTKVRNGETERERLDRAAGNARERESQAATRLDAARSGEAEARGRWGEAQRAAGAASARVQDMEAKEREASEMPAGDLDALGRADEEVARAVFERDRDLESARARHAAVARNVERLRAGLPVYPEAVGRTLDALEKGGIPAVIAASRIEVRDADCADAAEAALGHARFALLVAPRDEPAAVDLARRHEFPGPVFAGTRIGVGETAGPLTLSPGAPAWLRDWVRVVRLDSDGSWRDERGTWVAPARERVLGTSGVVAALAAAEKELEEAVRFVAAAEKAAASARQCRAEVVAALNRERRRWELLAAIAELPAAREAKRVAEAALAAAQRGLDAAVAAREAADEEHRSASMARATTEEAVQQHALRLAGEREALARAEEAVRECDAKAAEVLPRVTPELRVRAERGELDGVDTVRSDLARAREEFARLGDPPPPEVREEVKHLRANVEELEGHVAARRREAEAARVELAECRSRYLGVVSASLMDYRRRAVDIATGADVTVEMDLPRLTDDDRMLDEAAIEARFGFDGKDPLPLGDPSFSGGQQVIAGLILLMAMAEIEGQGFFMLDEPFAHLSPDRVDQVGRFLRGTRSQFIVTAPTTLDRAQLDPASLVIVLQKKKPHEPHAPVPIVADA